MEIAEQPPQATTSREQPEADGGIWKSSLTAAAVLPATACALLSTGFVGAGLRSVADLGPDSGPLLVVALMFAVLTAVWAHRLVMKVRRVSRRLVVTARAVEYATEDADARALRKAVDDFADCLAGARVFVGRIFPRRHTRWLVEQMQRETSEGRATLSPTSVSQVRQVRAAASRWQDPVA
ncbi:hypothetical protein [Streptomyces sp. NBC_01304]|uniref:hypothetical protein n=1 Tax=Streptomyces sp. NBC_01304 TaxID=2903818 RepID=UPI002E0E12B7|nr:hypothetical protein OG430_48815 [Streptomyces sp. NBC_01304]